MWKYSFQNKKIYEGWSVQIFRSIGGFKLFLNEMGFRRQAIIDISTSMVFKTIWVIPRRRNEKKSLIVLFWRKPNPFEIFYIIYIEIFSCYSQIETKFKNSYTFDGLSSDLVPFRSAGL